MTVVDVHWASRPHVKRAQVRELLRARCKYVFNLPRRIELAVIGSLMIALQDIEEPSVFEPGYLNINSLEIEFNNPAIYDSGTLAKHTKSRYRINDATLCKEQMYYVSVYGKEGRVFRTFCNVFRGIARERSFRRACK
jgi:hypothetical protein